VTSHRLAAAALAVLLACAPTADPNPPVERIPASLVEARGEVAQRILHGGGALVADYGSYQLIDVSAQGGVHADPSEVQVRDEYRFIQLNAGPIDTTSAHAATLRGIRATPSGRQLHLVQFRGPVQPGWYQALAATGVRIVTAIPHNSYLVYGDAEAMTRVQDLAAAPFVQWDGAFLDDYKVHPLVYDAPADAYAIQMVEDPDANPASIALARQGERRPAIVDRSLGYTNLIAFIDRAAAVRLALRPDVVSIHPYVTPRKRDERQNMIVSGNLNAGGTAPTGPGYLAWLASKGFNQGQFTASGFAVDITDSGLDNATPAAPNHFALYELGNVLGSSRVVYARLEGTPNGGSTIQGCDGHGTLNAHIVGGFVNRNNPPHVDAAGFSYGLGIAPWVKLGSSVIFDPDFYTFPDFEDMLARGFQDGTRVSTNSWGAAVGGAYTVDSQRYDGLVRDAQPTGSAVPAPGNQEMAIIFAAGNSGPGANSVGSPGTAKNVLSAGASENNHPFGGADQCGVGDPDANSPMDVAFFSSRGPLDDQRVKPDLMAPGTHVSGGVAQANGQRAEPPANPNGQALSCFNAGGVCAGAGGSDFHPAGQQWTTASSGTSHSTPAIAGGAALVRQHFINQGMPPPTPAMTKAVLMNSARYMNGAGANDTLPSNNQGMGLMDLERAFDATPRRLRDQDPADLLTATGQTRVFTVYPADPSKPFRVTLAWTDAPGPTAGNAYLNNLDLTVTVGATTYRGNVFSGSASAPGGTADLRNNVESVFLPTFPAGQPITVTVTATNINSDGVPGNATPLDQDFALVIYNACNNQPAAPGGLTATVPGNNQVQLTWTSTGAPGYTIHRSFTAGGPYTQVGTSATPSFLDTTVSGGTTYFYVVRALDCAESADSNEASATATGSCTLPPFFAGLASASNAQTSTCGVNLTWAAGAPACGGTLTYNVYRSQSSTFTPSVANRIASGLTGTSFNDMANLQNGVTYYYVVRAVEAAATTVEDPNTVRRNTAPTGAVTPSFSFFDDLDGNRPPNAAAYWRENSLSGPEDLTLVSGCRHHSASTAYRFGPSSCAGTYAVGAINELQLGGDGTVSPSVNGFVFPPGARGTMTFRHAYRMEAGFDGAVLLYNTTGFGGPYQLVGTTPSPTAPYITSGGYNGTVSGGLPAWTGDNAPPNGSFLEVTVNLDGLAGQTAWFGWGFVSDSTVTSEGHFLDNVSIQASTVAACTPGTAPPGPAGSFVVTLPPTAGAGTPVPASFEARDGAGQRATGYNGSALLTSSDPQAILPGPVSFVNGVASAPVEFRTIGTQSLVATDSVDPQVTGMATTTVTSGPPASLAYLSQPADAQAGQPIGPVIRVEVRDALGNPVTVPTAVTMSIANNPGGGTLLGTTTQNTSGGVATFNNLAIDRAASGYTLQATVASVAPLVSAAFNITVGPAAAVDFTAQPTDAQAGAAITPSVVARVHDGFGNTVTGWANPVVVSIASNPSGGTLTGTLSRMPVAGVATFDDLSIDRAGAGYTLRAGSGALTPGISAGFSISPAAPDRVVITRQPSNAVAGTPIAPSVQAQVRDRFGNLCTSATTAVTATLGNANGATLLGTTTVNASGGLVTFGDLAVDRVGSNYVLNLDSPGLTGAVSTPFAISTGPASLVGFATPPADTVAGAIISPPVRVSVTDAFGNPIAGSMVTIALANNPTGAVLTGSLVQATSAGGIATFSDLRIQVAGAGYTLRASAGSLNATSAGFAITPAAASALEITTQPSSIVAGAPITPAVAVRVRDTFGNTVTGYGTAVTASLSANPPGNGVLSGTTSRVPVAGVATFDDLTIDRVGNGYRIALASGALPVVNTSLFNVTPAAPDRVVLSRQPSTSVAGVPFSPAVQALIQDRFGNITPSAATAVTASLGNAGSATLLGTTTVNAVNGIVNFPDLAVDLVGTGYVLHLDAPGLTRGTSDAFGITPAAPARLEYTVQPSDAVAGAAIAPGVRVAAKDAFGNVATSFASQVTVSLAVNPSGGVLTGTRSVNAAAGIATFSNLLLDKAGGGYALNASASGLGSVVSSSFAVLPAAADRLSFSVQPSRATAGASIAPAIQVQVLDRFNNLTTSTATVAVAIQTNPGGGTLSGTTSVAASGGVASFADLSIDRAAAGYRLSVTSTGLTSALSNLFDIDPGPAAALGFRVQPSRTAAGANIAPAVTVEVRDALGNLVRTAGATSITLGLGANPGGATLMGTTTATAVNGVASFNALSIQRAGSGYTLTADAAALTQGVSAAFDVVAAAPAALAFSTPPASTTAGTPFTVALEARDAFGNLTSGYSGTVTLALGSNPAGGVLAGTTSVAASGGTATFGGLSIAKAGTGYSLAASASGLMGADSGPFDIAAGPAAALEITGLAATVTAYSETAFSVRAVDGSGNLADLNGPATVSSSDATATVPASVTFSGGQANDLRITFKQAGTQTVTVTQGSLSVTGTVTVEGLTAPVVSITSPLDGTRVSGVVPITATGAVASATTLTKIEIFVDGAAIGSGTESPTSVAWDTTGLVNGSIHQLTAVITDGTGATATSAVVTVTVGSAGGCGSTSGGSGAFSLIGLAALALFRRRRAALARR
jgi:uncharacterized protein (TIGR03382 family)